MIRSQQGWVSIEAALSLTFVSAGLAVALVILYSLMVSVWIHFATYEAALCLAKDQSPSVCERLSQKQITNVLKWGGIKSLRLHRSGPRPQQVYTANITWSIPAIGDSHQTVSLKESQILRQSKKTNRGMLW